MEIFCNLGHKAFLKLLYQHALTQSCNITPLLQVVLTSVYHKIQQQFVYLKLEQLDNLVLGQESLHENLIFAFLRHFLPSCLMPITNNA